MISFKVALNLSINESECVANDRSNWWISICDDCCFITSANAVSCSWLVERTKWLRLKMQNKTNKFFMFRVTYFSIFTLSTGSYKSLVKSQYLIWSWESWAKKILGRPADQLQLRTVADERNAFGQDKIGSSEIEKVYQENTIYSASTSSCVVQI